MESLTFRIRRATIKDVKKITNFYSKELPSTHPSNLIKKTIKFNLTSATLNPPTHVFIAYQHSEILALAITHFRATYNAYEIECTTKKTFRRLGLGSYLIEHSIKNCQTNGFSSFVANVSPNNLNIIKLLEKLGFKLRTTTSSTPLTTYYLSLEK
ncbi:GNAT family N-acetyltransferase [Pseudomonas fluorescens]|uniref:GNAT family N-acetyltransferase n=1 Tax=Pseudomonas fluorescens TaxID=294 RepID=UPI001240EDC8|nr:GNAT family N-acetyltransferase [Pseudomonas fluorescens]